MQDKQDTTMQGKQDFLSDIHDTLQAYQQARERRKELLGPSALDTAVSLTRTTIHHLHDGVDQLADTIHEKATNLKTHLQDAWENRETLRERISHTMRNWREYVANRLEDAADRLRGWVGDKDKVRSDERNRTNEETTQETPHPSNTPNESTQSTMERADTPFTQPKMANTSTQPTSATQPKTEKRNRSDNQSMTPEEMMAFAQYYYDNYDRVTQALETVDKKEQPTFKDYAIASGFNTFWQEWKGQSTSPIQPVMREAFNPTQTSDVQQVIQDVQQLKASQERLEALKQEQMQLEQNIAHLSNQYGIHQGHEAMREQPVTHKQPVYEQPVYEQPVYEQPVYDHPAYTAEPEHPAYASEPPAMEFPNLAYDVEPPAMSHENFAVSDEDLMLTADDLSEFANMDNSFTQSM